MVSFNTTQKRDQGITQSHMKSLSSHISVQDRKTLCSAKAHFPRPAMRPGTPAWCFLLAPPSPDTPMSETAGGDVTFRIISESHVSLFTPTVRGVPQPWGALQARPRCTEAQKSFVRMLREEARGLCPAGAARSGAGTAAPPALSMCRPSRTETAPGPGKTRAQGAKREGRSEPCLF